MRLAWVTRSFLDYRVPVYAELSRIVDGEFHLFYCADVVPERVRRKAGESLGERAVGLSGERRLGPKNVVNGLANQKIRIPWQPGLIKQLRRCSPDVVISDGFFQWTTAALWLRARYGIAHLMCYERTAHMERHAQWFRRWYRKLAMRWIDAICCTGSLCGQYAQSLGFPANRMTYGHMVADIAGLHDACERVSAAECQAVRRQNDLSGLVYLYVGRMVAQKGVPELLDAWTAFRDAQSREAATLVMIGDGPDRGAYEQLCRNKNIQSVRFLGPIDYDRLPSYYAAADVFVMPTLEDNWSLVVPEAMACGLPILCSKYNGCWPELVQEGVNGWVFDPMHADEIVTVLRQVLENSSQLERMGQCSHRIVSAHSAITAARAVFDGCQLAYCD